MSFVQNDKTHSWIDNQVLKKSDESLTEYEDGRRYPQTIYLNFQNNFKLG